MEQAEEIRSSLKVFMVFSIVELVLIAIGVLASESLSDISIMYLPLLFFLLINMGLSILTYFIAPFIPPVKLSELMACLNIAQAIAGSIIAKVYLSNKFNVEESRFSASIAFAVSITVKHVYLLDATSYLLRIFTVCCILTAYFIANEAITHQSSLVRFQVVVFLVFAFAMLIIKLASDEKSIRKLFLAKKKSEETDVLIHKLLPLSVLITRYDRKEERLYFHSANNQIQRTFAVNNDDTMKALLMKVNLSVNFSQSQAFPQASLFQHLHLQARHQSSKSSNILTTNTTKTSPQQQPLVRKKTLKRRAFADTEQESQHTHKGGVGGGSGGGGGGGGVCGTFGGQQQSGLPSATTPRNYNLNGNNFGNSVFLQAKSLVNNDQRGQQQRSGIIAQNVDEVLGNGSSGAFGFTNIDTGRSKKRTEAKKPFVAKQLTQLQDNLTYDSCGDNLDREPTNRNNGGGMLASQQAHNNSQMWEAEEILDRVDFIQGVLMSENPKTLSIKIYTYELEDIYQMVILEDESLRGKLDYQTRLNRYYVELFQTMLKKLRVPIAQSLYRMRKAIQSMKQSSTLLQHTTVHEQKFPLPQLQFFQSVYSHQAGSIVHQVPHNPPDSFAQLNSMHNTLEFVRTVADIGVIGGATATATASASSSTTGKVIQHQLQHDSDRPSLDSLASETNMFYRGERGSISSFIGQEATNITASRRDQLLPLVEGLQFCSFGILNNLFNFQDAFRILQKKQLLVKPDHLSLARVIADLKTIFHPEFLSRGQAIYFFNELSDDDSYINTDEKSLKQVLINLISNSLQSLSVTEQKGQSSKHTAVSFRLNGSNEEVIDVQVVDTGPGFREDEGIPRLNLHPLTSVQLERSHQQLRELKIGLAVSEKLVGRLGPYERLKISKNIVSFQIYRDYEMLIKQQQQQQQQQQFQQQLSNQTEVFFRSQSNQNFKKRKSNYGLNKPGNIIELEEFDIGTDKDPTIQIADAVRKVQIEQFITQPPGHTHYDFQGGPTPM